MMIVLHKLDGADYALLFEQLMKLIQQSRLVLIEQLFSFEVVIRRYHDIIKIAVGHF
jgi:hypothetical protein